MQNRLDHPDHFHHNQPASVAALRSLIEIRRNADRLPSGTLIDFTRIRKLRAIFDKLAIGANKELLDDLREMPFGSYGHLADKYGVHWFFQGDKSQT